MDEFKSVAIDAAQAAGQTLLELAKSPIRYEMKNSLDIQAEADLRSEQLIINKIREAFPSHSIFAEESGEDTTDSEYMWTIDPLDGTINYSRGIDEYCVSIALSRRGQTTLGVIYQPVKQELFVAEAGKGAYLNDKKLRVAEGAELVNCLAATDNTSNLEARRRNLRLLAIAGDNVRHVRIFGSAALHMAGIADGQLDFYFKDHYHHWDYAAGVLLVQEAGGIVTDLDGRPITRDSTSILAAGSTIHAQALKLLNTP